MAKLTQTPSHWFVECQYCDATDMGHERELLAKARILCKNYKEKRFLDFVIAEMDRLDHSELNEIGQAAILTAIHEKTGCDCLTSAIREVENEIKASFTVTVTRNAPSQRHAPKQPKSLLDRLKTGRHSPKLR